MGNELFDFIRRSNEEMGTNIKLWDDSGVDHREKELLKEKDKVKRGEITIVKKNRGRE